MMTKINYKLTFKNFKMKKKNLENKNSFMNMLLIMMMLFSTLFTINSSSWFNAWMGMEMNLMAFIPLMKINNKVNKTSNPMMIYFIIQSIASSILMMMIILMKMKMSSLLMNPIMNMIQFSILMKLGAFPFHWWLPKMIFYLNWINCLIMLTWQKIAPLFLLMILNSNTMLYLSSIFSTIIGALMGINQSSLKMIMVYSSINHLGWLMMSMILNFKLLMYYFSIYLMINFLICMTMNKFNLNYINQIIKNQNQNIYNKMIMLSLFLSLGGLPPMLGFLPKFLILMVMIKNNLIIETMVFTIMAIISLSFYINPLMSVFIFIKLNNKWNNKIMSINKMIFNIMLINLMMMFFFMNMFLMNIY
nr:NADH dehydrogenase subunit 2 [Eutomostethus vegetus]